MTETPSQLLRDVPDDPFETPPYVTDPESPEWAAGLEVLAKREAIFERVRALLGVDEHTCVGCYLGDDGPATHDLGYGCQYGKGAS